MMLQDGVVTKVKTFAALEDALCLLLSWEVAKAGLIAYHELAGLSPKKSSDRRRELTCFRMVQAGSCWIVKKMLTSERQSV